MPKDFKGPRKVPNYTPDLEPASWIETYEIAMDMLDVNEAVCARYFTMMLEGSARTWLKNLPPNSIQSWAELKERFIKNFRGTCKRPMTIVDLQHCVQRPDESAHHWSRRVAEIIHSSDGITAAQAVLILEHNCHYEPLVQKLGRLKRKVQDMGELMDTLTRYAEADDTKDPGEDGKANSPKKGESSKNHTRFQGRNRHNQGTNGKRRPQEEPSDLVANTNANNGKKKNRGFSGKRPCNYEELLKGPCPHHATADGPVTHSWENCFVMREFRAEAIKKSQNDDPDQRQEQFATPNQRQNPFSGFPNRGLRGAHNQAAANTRCTTSGGITRQEPSSSHPHRGLRRVRMIMGASAATPNSKSAYPIGRVRLTVAFGNAQNYRSESLIFEVVKLKSPYHALFGRTAYARFMARPCYVYLKLKMPGPKGPVMVDRDRRIAKECEEGDAAYAEVTCATEELKHHRANADPADMSPLKKSTTDSESPLKFKPTDDTKTIDFVPGDSSKQFTIGTGLDPK
ncbi:hypothetical protein ZWY2020_013737 [Hordeum vulgare]|nr:hypothetical protein ZWY2020_013737 [Hordeum vulgare]